MSCFLFLVEIHFFPSFSHLHYPRQCPLLEDLPSKAYVSPLCVALLITGLSPPSVGFSPPFFSSLSFRSPLLKEARLIFFPLLRCFTSRYSFFSVLSLIFFHIIRTLLISILVPFTFLIIPNKIPILSRK